MIINGIECEVIFAPPDWNKLCEKPWTYHWNDNGYESGFDEYFRTGVEAEISMKSRINYITKNKKEEADDTNN